MQTEEQRVKQREAVRRYTNTHREIINARQRQKRKENPRPQRNRVLQHRFGITIEKYDEMLLSQNGSCAICKKQNIDDRSFDVDHCHGTGKIRGLLCGNCNRGIGNLQDNPAILCAAIEYLNSYL